MIPLQEKIDRTLRMLHRMEQDLPLLAIRVAPLAEEQQKSAKKFAEQMMVHTRAELDRLMAMHVIHNEPTGPQGAD